jgi:dienelactone hydrolase
MRRRLGSAEVGDPDDQSRWSMKRGAWLLSAMAWSITAMVASAAAPDAAPASGNGPSMAERLSKWRAELPQASGPYRVVRLIEPGFTEHTVYRPADLTRAGKLPIIAFANGACRNTSLEYAAFLSELASHGYMVIAVGRDDQPMGASAVGQTTSPDGRLLQVLDEKTLQQAVDWAIARNAEAASLYRGKLRADRIAYMGHSCGGMQALTASADPRTTTTVVLNSGYYRTPPARPPGPLPAYRRWSELHAPTLILTGGSKDVAYAIAKDSYEDGAAANLPVFLASLPPLAHSGAYVEPDKEWSRVVVAWLDWQLKADRKARAQFVGKTCGLCTNSAWQDVAAHGLR